MTTCAVDLMERGMKIAKEQGIHPGQQAVFSRDEEGRRCACALGVMLLASGRQYDEQCTTPGAKYILSKVCPSLNRRVNEWCSYVAAIPIVNDDAEGDPWKGTLEWMKQHNL